MAFAGGAFRTGSMLAVEEKGRSLVKAQCHRTVFQEGDSCPTREFFLDEVDE